MNDWRCPSINISGAPLQATSISWAITSGVEPYVAKIVVNKGASGLLDTMPNPVFLSWTTNGGTEGEASYKSVRFDNLYLIEKRGLDEMNDLWYLADARWLFRGKRIYCSYNKTRIANTLQVGTPATDETDIANIRQPFELYAAGRYLPWSISSGTVPYKMSEIIQLELQKIGIYPVSNIIQDSDYVLENIEMNGVDFYDGMAELLSRGRLNMSVSPSGEIYIYSLDYYADDKNIESIMALNEVRVSPGRLYIQDKQRMRPRRVYCQFEKLMETRVIASSSNDLAPGAPLPVYENKPLWSKVDSDSKPPRVIGCENVIRVPYETDNLIAGGTYKAGEYAPMWEYLASIGLPEDKVQQLWFSDHLYRWYAKKKELEMGTGFTVESERFSKYIIANIKNHYRQVYRIEPYWCDRIEKWYAKRVTSIDNYTKYTPPSPVFADYCVIPNQKCPIFSRRKALGETQAYNWIVRDNDIYRTRVTPGTLQVLNHDLGIFKVFFPPLVDQVISEIIPCAVAPLPYPATSSGSPLIESCHLTGSHTFETIISVKWSVAEAQDKFDSPSKFYSINMAPKEEGTGPPIEFVSKKEYARYSVREMNLDGTIINDQDRPVNSELLGAIANAENSRLLMQYKNRPCGLVEVPGFVGMRLNGHMVGIIYTFDTASGLKTTIDLRGQVPSFAVESYLTTGQLSYLYKQLPRGDFKNEMGGNNEN
jgi:hypothetical protein